MGRVFDAVASGISSKPRIALAALIVATLALASGAGILGEQADSTVFLPESSDVAEASQILAETFPDSAGLAAITTLHRGDVLTPSGLDHIDRTMNATLAVPGVSERLAIVDPVFTPTEIFKSALQVQDLTNASQAQIDGVVQAAATNPELDAALSALIGEADGEGLALTSIRLRTLEDREGLEEIELAIADLVETVEGPLDIRSLSSATIDQESDDATASSMGTLVVIALAVIAALLYVFFRTGSDLALSLVGLGVIIAGTLGAQGWMGPDGLGIIGQPNTLTTLVPIMLIGLSVDYAIQSVSHYREIRATGANITDSVRRGLRGVLLPLVLAAGTTIISFLTNLVSPIPANQDFGVVAGFGVFWGLAVMLILMPAARAIIDGRKAAKSTIGPVRPMADAIPGAGAVVERVGVGVARAPMLILAVVALVSIVLSVAATNISTEFDSNDFLPGEGDSVTDLEALDEAFGGQTELVNVLIEAELTDDRTLRNLVEVSSAFGDELSRPEGVAGPITSSIGTLFLDWSTDDGPGDENYDPGLLSQAESIDQGLTLDPAGVQALIDRLEELDPVGFALVASDNPNGVDRLLLQYSALTGDQDRTRQMVADLEGLWFGDDTQITATSGDIIELEVTDSMTDSQSAAIATTIIAALTVLVIFFGVTEFKPMLGFIAVGPILLVLMWVLGTMTLVGIPYNVVTALITALSIGIGVDYTIHVIHRFTEELEHRGDVVEATKATLGTTGSALIGSALTTALGFGVLVFSPLTPFLQFGLVTGITIIYALLASVIVVPPLLVVWAAYHRWRAEATLETREPAAAQTGT